MGRLLGTRAVLAALCAAMVASVIVVAGAAPADAHTPHDDIRGLALSPDYAEDRTVYTISRSYVLKSTDGGESWTRLVNGIDRSPTPYSIAVSPADASTVYLATRGAGVYVSRDAGGSWEQMDAGLESLDDRNIGRIVAHPSTPGTAAIVTIVGDVLLTTDAGAGWSRADVPGTATSVDFVPGEGVATVVGTDDGAVHVLADGEEDWATATIDGSGPVTTVAVSPDFADDGTVFAGTETGGVWTSTDGGASFTQTDTGLADPWVMSFAVPADFGSSETLWASTYTDGAHVSTDGGATWARSSEGTTPNVMADDLGVAQYYEIVVGDAGDGAHELFLAGYDGLFRSSDGGATWTESRTQESTNVVGLAVSPDFGEDQTLATSSYLNGVKISTDGGDTWTPINAGLAAEFEWTRSPEYFVRLFAVHFSPTYRSDGELFTSTRGYFLRYDPDEGVWTPEVPEGLLVEGEAPTDYWFTVASPDYARDGTLILGSDGGKIFRSTDRGHTFTRLDDIGPEVTALAISPDFAEDGTVLAGTVEGAFISTDRAESWTRLGDPVRIESVSVSPDYARDRTLFVATDRGLRHTTDAGETWTAATAPGLGFAADVEAVAVSPAYADDGTVFMTIRGRGLYRSTDGGVAFEPIAPELLDQQVVFSDFYHSTAEPLVVSPDFAEDRTLFGYAEDAIYRSTDAGDTWQRLDIEPATHDTDPGEVPRPFLVAPRFGNDPTAQGEEPDDGATADQPRRGNPGFRAELGLAHVSRAEIVLAGGVGLVVFALLSWVRFGREELWQRLVLRAAISGALVVAILYAFAKL